jgi:hypothetical protein
MVLRIDHHPATLPRIVVGSGFGQNGSTWKLGVSPATARAGVETDHVLPSWLPPDGCTIER